MRWRRSSASGIGARGHVNPSRRKRGAAIATSSAGTVSRPASRSTIPCSTSSAPGIPSSSTIRDLGQELFDLLPEHVGIDRGITNQRRFDLLEALGEPIRRDEPTRDHLAHVVEIPSVPAFDLRERLPVEVVVIELHWAMGLDEATALSPPGQRRNEVVRRCELDIDVEL